MHFEASNYTPTPQLFDLCITNTMSCGEKAHYFESKLHVQSCGVEVTWRTVMSYTKGNRMLMSSWGTRQLGTYEWAAAWSMSG